MYKYKDAAIHSGKYSRNKNIISDSQLTIIILIKTIRINI